MGGITLKDVFVVAEFRGKCVHIVSSDSFDTEKLLRLPTQHV